MAAAHDRQLGSVDCGNCDIHSMFLALLGLLAIEACDTGYAIDEGPGVRTLVRSGAT